MSKVLKALAAGAFASTLIVQPALTAGGGGGGGDTPTCSNGKVWDQKKGKCVNKSSQVDDDSLFEAGRKLAKAEKFEEAIEVLKLVKDQNQPRVLNYLGYSNRKAGRIETGLDFYRKALEIDPDYVLARSYMGEALINIGDRQGALLQLAEIRKRTGPQGEAYILLASALRDGTSY